MVKRTDQQIHGHIPLLAETDEFLSADPTPRWFAVYTTPRHEKSVSKYCDAREIDCFLPLYNAEHKWRNGSNAKLELPLFPSYVFVRIGNEEKSRVLDVPGVLWVLRGIGGKPAPLADIEIDNLRAGLHLRRAQPHPLLMAGQWVRIRSGALAGMTGIVIRQKNSLRVVLTLKMIMQSVAVEVDSDNLDLLDAQPLQPDTNNN